MENNSTFFSKFIKAGILALLLFPFTTLNAQIPVEVYGMTLEEAPPELSISLVDCETAPVITCPPIYTGCPNDDTSPSITGMATAIAGDANCPNPMVMYHDSIITTGNCAGEMEIQRLWTATYPTNTNPLLFAYCTQLITLEDNDGPVISNGPANIMVAPGTECNAMVTWDEPSATDNCELQSFSSDFTSGSTFPLGITTVTYIATDECGNTSSYSFTIEVSGSCCFDAPALSCPMDYTGCPSFGGEPAITGQATATMGSDFCGEAIITYTDEVVSSNSCGEATIIRTWVATDEDNPSQVSTCLQNIQLIDDKSPLLTNLPQDITLDPDANCSAVATWSDIVVTDNCGDATLNLSMDSGSTFNEGTTTVIVTATDPCGNTTEETFNVTVNTCCTNPPSITCPADFNGCPGEEISPTAIATCDATPTNFTGWTVATCNGEAGTDDRVGVIYDIRNTTTAPSAQDWVPSITEIEPANWTLMQIGQIFGIAIGGDDVVYLAASDIYDTQYDTDPFGPGQLFVARQDNGFLAEPFIELPNTGGPLNGIGNIVYDRLNHQLFASNLEDGQIYRIALNGAVIETYDPWAQDNGSAGIVAQAEQVWGIGLNTENGIQKLYFPRINGSTREMHSLALEGGAFPIAGSEIVEFANIMGVGERISDIDFSSDGSQMIFAERGTRFTTGAHDSKTLRYDLVNGTWQMAVQYFVGSLVTDQFPSIPANTGENTAGGVSFGPISVDNTVNGCDELVYTTMNYLRDPNDGSLYYGIQGFDVDGNNPTGASTDPNIETDIIIDFDGDYNSFIQKGDLGDVEVFDAGGSVSSSLTGIATATSGGNGCGVPLLTFSDEIISTGDCDGEHVIERTWTATDANNPDLTSNCTQMIVLEDNDAPSITNVPGNITLAPSTNCDAVATWTAPSATDNCGLESLTSNFNSGDVFTEGTTEVIYTATDNCGNVSTTSFTVTVTVCCDQNPVILCPADYTGCPDNSTSPSTTGQATATAGSTACGTPDVTYSDAVISTGPCNGATEIERTWTATDPDNSNLLSSCTQIIILIDNEAPTITNVPSDITLDPSTSCNAIATWTAPTVNDNCGVQSLTSNFNSGDVFSEGNTQVVFTVTDNCGNTTTASFIVTVADCCSQSPIVNCAADFTGCITSSTDPSNTGISTAIAGSSNCAVPNLAFTDNVVSTGNCAGERTIARTWIATDPDNSGLTASCVQMIYLVDDTPPLIINCPNDITVNTSNGAIAVDWVEPTAIDGCGLEWIDANFEPGDIFPLGSTTVSYTAIDNCENVTTCSFVVTVESAGSIMCPDDIVVDCFDNDAVYFDVPTINTDCNTCNQGDSIPGFLYMGSLNGSSYYCSTSPATKYSAISMANSFGGHLASISSQEENDLLAGFLNTQCALIGLNDIDSEGTFTWSNGEPVTYTNWADYQPNNGNNSEDCTVLCVDGWYDTHCGIAFEYIMELPCLTIEQTSGLPSGSVFPIGTDTISYLVTDVCGNELTCSFTVTVEEAAELWCPGDHTFDAPSGSTGVYAQWDTPELTSCCTDCADGGYIPGYVYMGSFDGSQYYCSASNATWPLANAYAQNMGGHLAEINNEHENAFIANILTLQRAWIGLNDVHTEGVYKWSTGNGLGYSNWYPGQPNNKDNYQDYVSMLSDGYWNDEYNNLSMEYIVELPCSNSTVTQIEGPSSGSFIPVGTTTISYAGIDGCGNVDTCSFDITINGTSACQSYGMDTWYTWIQNFGLAYSNNVSGNNGGYADFTSGNCINVNKGNTYPITLGPGFSSSLYTVYWKIWIDYNQDGDYLDSGEYVAYGSGYQELNGYLPISYNAATGNTTLRVSMKYGEWPTGPCEVFAHGEVEDYCLNISGGSLKDGDETNRNSDVATLIEQSDNSNAHFVEEELIEPQGEEESNIEFYPNPSTGIVYFKGQLTSNKYEIYNNVGQVIKTVTIDKNVNSFIDLSDLSNGLYILRSNDGSHTQKILIVK